VNEANGTIYRSKSGQVGFYVSESLKPVYREIAGLLGISFDAIFRKDFEADERSGKALLKTEVLSSSERTLDDSKPLNYEAILVDGISLTNLYSLILKAPGLNQPKPLILICGPITGENHALRLKTFSFNLGQEGTRLLMEGREYTEKQVSEPTLDLMLEEIRAVLRREVRNYIELPPTPWGYSYTITLTHDIDILSLKEMPISRTFLGYCYRSSVLNWKQWRSGKVQTSEFLRSLWEIGRTWAAKVGLGQDVWKRALPALLELEKRLGVRSSLYFMPFPGKPGILPESLSLDKLTNINSNNGKKKESAPMNRASFYDIVNSKESLNRLEEGGWEAGVHGIDAWHDDRAARAEYKRVADLTDQDEIGVRMHWLYFKSPESFESLEKGGFKYDATFGFNEVVGFRAGTLQPYHPLNCRRLWELPLHIQDGALLGEEHLDLTREEAFLTAKPILDWAKHLGGTVSLLWHNQSFTAPRFWGEVYERLIAQGREDGAWIAIPREVLRWFDLRRRCEVSLSIDGTRWQINVVNNPVPLTPSMQIPPLRIRLHLDPKRVRAASVPYEAGDGYLDFPAQALVTLDVEGER